MLDNNIFCNNFDFCAGYCITITTYYYYYFKECIELRNILKK